MEERIKMKTKYTLVKAHHPKRFEKGVYAVSFVKKGKPKVDRNTKFFQVKAKNRLSAIRIARKRI